MKVHKIRALINSKLLNKDAFPQKTNFWAGLLDNASVWQQSLSLMSLNGHSYSFHYLIHIYSALTVRYCARDWEHDDEWNKCPSL